MTIDLEKLKRLDMSFPGFSFGYESWALSTYLEVLDEHISFASEQYKLRAKRELEKDADMYPSNETAHEYSEIEEAAEFQIPRYFRIGALIPIWGLFESFVSDVARYTMNRESNSLTLREIRAPNFRSQVEKYFEDVLNIALPWSAEQRNSVGALQEVRNIIAHRNGRLMDLHPNKRRESEKLVKSVDGVEIQHSSIIVSGEYITASKDLVFKMLESLISMIADRYDGPII
jgi:hypothetical protein